MFYALSAELQFVEIAHKLWTSLSVSVHVTDKFSPIVINFFFASLFDF